MSWLSVQSVISINKNPWSSTKNKLRRVEADKYEKKFLLLKLRLEIGYLDLISRVIDIEEENDSLISKTFLALISPSVPVTKIKINSNYGTKLHKNTYIIKLTKSDTSLDRYSFLKRNMKVTSGTYVRSY